MKKMRVLATIEARMSSKRLPGKVMKKILNYPILEILIKRTLKSKLIDEVIVATTINKKDNKIANFLRKKGYRFYRGKEYDVAHRLIRAAKKFKGDIIVQLTADNPIVDPKMIDHMLKFFLKNYPKYNYVTNNGFGKINNRSVPIGMDIQIFTLENLIKIYKNMKKSNFREHPSLYFYAKRNNKYNIKNLNLKKFWSLKHKPRLTIDTIQDFILIEKIFENIGKKNLYFDTKKIKEFYLSNNNLFLINKSIRQKKVIL